MVKVTNIIIMENSQVTDNNKLIQCFIVYNYDFIDLFRKITNCKTYALSL